MTRDDLWLFISIVWLVAVLGRLAFAIIATVKA
jgi:hypothetical protein